MIKRKDGRWQEHVRIDGKVKYFYGKTEREVTRKIAAYKGELKRSRTFAEVADEWDTEHAENVSYNAHRAYSVPYKSVVDAFGDMAVNSITPQAVQQYITALCKTRIALRTAKGYMSVLKMIFSYGILHGDCESNPAELVKLPRGLKTTKRTLPDENAIQQIKANVDAPFGLFAFVVLYTGCRRGEVLGLKGEDIDRKNNLIHVRRSIYYKNNAPYAKSTKTTAGERDIILLGALAEKLPEKANGYLFGGDNPLTLCAFVRRWDAYAKAAGIAERLIRYATCTRRFCTKLALMKK